MGMPLSIARKGNMLSGIILIVGAESKIANSSRTEVIVRNYREDAYACNRAASDITEEDEEWDIDKRNK